MGGGGKEEEEEEEEEEEATVEGAGSVILARDKEEEREDDADADAGADADEDAAAGFVLLLLPLSRPPPPALPLPLLPSSKLTTNSLFLQISRANSATAELPGPASARSSRICMCSVGLRHRLGAKTMIHLNHVMGVIQGHKHHWHVGSVV